MNFLRCSFYLIFLGFLSFFFGRILPKSWINAENFPFRTYAREDKFYCRIKVRTWQGKMPDMSRAFPSLMPPKNLAGDYRERLPEMVTETCVAELTHWLLAFLSLPCMLIWQGLGGVIFALLFFLGNLPFIMIQRYTRPRLIRLAKKIAERGHAPMAIVPEKSESGKEDEVRECGH